MTMVRHQGIVRADQRSILGINRTYSWCEKSYILIFFAKFGAKLTYILAVVNAFVSMGGNNDRSGFVKKDTIIDIVKNVFELSIDMEDFLEKVGALQEELDFQSFCLLFEGGEDTKSLSRASSLLSVRIEYED